MRFVPRFRTPQRILTFHIPQFQSGRLIILILVFAFISPSLGGERQSNEEFRAARRRLEEYRESHGFALGYHTLIMLTSPHVRHELCLTDDQLKTAQELQRDFVQAVDNASKPARELLKRTKGKANRSEFADLLSRKDTVERNFAQQCEQMLDLDQNNRIIEIKFHLLSFDGLFVPQVIDGLCVTDIQLDELLKMRIDIERDFRDIFGAGHPKTQVDFDRRSARYWLLLEDYRTKALQILDAPQRDDYLQLCGRPFGHARFEMKFRIHSNTDDK